MEPKKIIVTVTNDLNQDQRMHRICNSLMKAGYDVLLLGRSRSKSNNLLPEPFQQRRLNCWFGRGILFYVEYNLRLIVFMLFNNIDIVYSVDLDTLIAGSLISKIKGKKLIFDAHEYFTEVPELEGKTLKKKIWSFIGRRGTKRSVLNITVNKELAKILFEKYNAKFKVIRSVPMLEKNNESSKRKRENILLYQGVLNKGRGLEEMITAMQSLDNVRLLIAGEGDLSQKLRDFVTKEKLNDKVKFLGWQSPEVLKELTKNATIGLNLLSSNSLNYKYSLANKFFDYMHASVPSINMSFPVYERILEAHKVGACIDNLKYDTLIASVNALLNNKELYQELQSNCDIARREYNWQKEEKALFEIVEDAINGI